MRKCVSLVSRELHIEHNEHVVIQDFPQHRIISLIDIDKYAKDLEAYLVAPAFTFKVKHTHTNKHTHCKK